MRLFKNFKGSALFLGLFIFYFLPFFVRANMAPCNTFMEVLGYLLDVGLVISSSLLPLIIFPIAFFILNRQIVKKIPDNKSRDIPKLKFNNILFSGIFGGLTALMSNNIVLGVRDYFMSDGGKIAIDWSGWYLTETLLPFVFSSFLIGILLVLISYFAIPKTIFYRNLYRMSQILSISIIPLIGIVLLVLLGFDQVASAQLPSQLSIIPSSSDSSDLCVIKASSWIGHANLALIAGSLLVVVILSYRNILIKQMKEK